MSVDEAIVKYFHNHDDFAALVNGKSEDPDIIEAFLIKEMCILNVKCRYTEDQILINSLVPDLAELEPRDEMLEMCNYINSNLKKGMVIINEQDSLEYKQDFPYAGMHEIDGLLDVAINNAWGLCKKFGKDFAFHAVSQILSGEEYQDAIEINFRT